jgi:hypothetical protein
MEGLHEAPDATHPGAVPCSSDNTGEDAARPRITYVSWAESCSRSDHTARELGGTSHMVYEARLGSWPATILFKYAAQWIRTARILRRERPETVFVMTPPVFAALPAFWYAWRPRKQVVLDAHTAAFLHPRSRRLQWLQKALCRRPPRHWCIPTTLRGSCARPAGTPRSYRMCR